MSKAKVLLVVVMVALFFGSFLYLRHVEELHHVATEQILASLYGERESIDSNLRAQIVGLQKKLVNLPKIFSKNQRALLVDMVRRAFAVDASEKITDQEIVARMFSREERKDLFAGKIVVQRVNEQLWYAVGVIDDHGEYSGAVERNLLRSTNVGADWPRLTAMASADLGEESGKINYQEKIALLKQICIDAAFDAEKTRLEFVAKDGDVAQINKKAMEAIRQLNHERLVKTLVVLGGNVLVVIIFALVLFRDPGRRQSPFSAA